MKHKIEIEDLIAIFGEEYLQELDIIDAFEELAYGQLEYIEGLSTLYSKIEEVSEKEILNWCKIHCKGDKI